MESKFRNGLIFLAAIAGLLTARNLGLFDNSGSSSGVKLEATPDLAMRSDGVPVKSVVITSRSERIYAQ